MEVEDSSNRPVLRKKRAIDRLKNQQLSHMLVVPSFGCVCGVYMCLFIVLLAFGLACLLSAFNTKDFEYRYDDKCDPIAGTDCTFTFNIDKHFNGPVYMYYAIDNFYANHRTFVKSRSYDQLRGLEIGGSELRKCAPITYNKDVKSPLKSWAGNTLNDTDIASPCGLIAKYYFTDKYEMKDKDGNAIAIDESGIALAVDKKFKFKRQANSDHLQYLDPEDEHLMVWYQMESFPNFIKLWGVIRSDIPPGPYTVTVKGNTWPAAPFRGKKMLYFSTVNALGGSYPFLGIAFLVAAGVVFLLMIFVVVMKYVRPIEKIYDHKNPMNLKWKK